MAPQSNHTVGLLGVTRNTDNYGVRVLLTSAVEILLTRHPDAQVIIVDYGHHPDAWIERTSVGEREVRLVNLRFSWRLHLRNNIFRLLALALVFRVLPWRSLQLSIIRRNPWLRAISQTDICYSLAGGDSFSDIYGMERFAYVALPQMLVLLMKRQLVLLPQTYGPFKRRITRVLARWIVARASQVYSRDSVGVQIIRALVEEESFAVRVTPDIGFCMQGASVAAAIMKRLESLRQHPLVGLNVSRLLYMGGYTRSNMFGLREPFPRLIEELAKHLANNLQTHVLLIPHVFGGPSSEEDETRLCKDLARELGPLTEGRTHYVDDWLDHQQIKTVIGQCDVFIGARMHACIAAVSQGVPTVCLAYSAKFHGVMAPLRSAATVVDLRTASIEETLAAVEQVITHRLDLREQLRAILSSLVWRARTLEDKEAEGTPNILHSGASRT